MPILIGTGSNQVPTNGDLGTMAFQDSAAISVGIANVSGDVAIGGNVSISGVIKGQAAALSGDVLFIGDNTKLVDINVLDTVGLYSQSNTLIGSLKLGSNGGIISGFNGKIGIGNLAPDATLSITGTANVSGNVVIGGITTHNANVILGSSGLSANGGFGTAGQLLNSNGTATYWAADRSANAYTNAVAYVDGKSYVNTSQLSSNLANYQTSAGLSANVATLTANSSTFLGTANLNNIQTFITSNASAAYTNAVAYVDGKSYVNTSQLSSNLANYQTTAGLSANVATLTANNATNLDGVPAASYVNTSGSYTITGMHTYSNGITFSNTITANGSNGTAGQVLTSSGATGNVYWATASGGGGGITTGKAIAMAMIFG